MLFLIYCACQPVVRLLACSGRYNDHINAYLFLLPTPLCELLSSIKTSLYKIRKKKREETKQPGQLIQIWKDFSYIVVSLKSAHDSWYVF